MKLIIGIHGLKGSGKTTLATQLCDRVCDRADCLDVRTVSFADPLKQLAIELFDLPASLVYGDNTAKNTATHLKWPNTDTYMTVRELLQYIGSDVCRAMDPDIWVKRWKREVNDPNYQYLEHEYNAEVIIADDIRFPNEAQAIRDFDKEPGCVTKLIKLTRVASSPDAHISENAMKDWKDYNVVAGSSFYGPDSIERQERYFAPILDKWLRELGYGD